MINTNRIKARIVEKGMTIQKVSKQLGLTPYTLGRKIRGETIMTLQEAEELQKILDIPDGSFESYFFCT